MVLNRWRKLGEKILDPIASNIKTNPNHISIIAFVFALFAGFCFYFTNFFTSLLLLASAFVFLNGFFDALDGRVAKIFNLETKKGDFLDHVLDRYADIFILVGIALSPYCNPIIVLFAIVGVLLASYIGTQAQAVGIGRYYGGMLGRADRLVILILAPLLQFLLPQKIWYFSILEWMMLYFAVFGNITAVQRACNTWEKLRQ